MAVASGVVEMAPATLAQIRAGSVEKGDVLGIARVAAIQASKRASELIPLCHPVRLTSVAVELDATDEGGRPRVEIRATARACDRTGVEMEALTAVAVAGLCIYDMCKSVDRGMHIGAVQLGVQAGRKIRLLDRATAEQSSRSGPLAAEALPQ